MAQRVHLISCPRERDRLRVASRFRDDDLALVRERVQQADILGQMRQLYGKGLGLVGLGAMFLRL